MAVLSAGSILRAVAGEAGGDAPTVGLKALPLLPTGQESGTQKPGKSEALKHEEMIQRMRLAIESIAAEFGNPLFLQLFGNDPQRIAQVRERLQNLDQRDELRREVAQLEQRKVAAETEIARIEARLTLGRDGLAKLQAALEGLPSDQKRLAKEQ